MKLITLLLSMLVLSGCTASEMRQAGDAMQGFSDGALRYYQPPPRPVQCSTFDLGGGVYSTRCR